MMNKSVVRKASHRLGILCLCNQNSGMLKSHLV